jgi:hypothetical protein
MIDPIKLEVSLGIDGLIVHLPSGRTINIGATEAGAKFLRQMLKDAEERRRYTTKRPGYVGGFPIQEIADIWQRQEEKRLRLEKQIQEHERRKAEERRQAWLKRGIDPDKIKVRI